MNRTLTPLVFAFGTSSLLLMDSAIKGSVILLGAACVAVMLKRDSAAMRHLVWLVAIVAMLVIPVFSVLLPRWQVLPAWAAISQSSPAIETSNRAVELPRPFEAATADSPEPFVPGEFDSQSKAIDTSFISEALEQARLEATQNDVGIDRVPSDPRWSWISILPFLWSIGFGVMVLRLIAARWMLWSNEQRATVIAVSGRPSDARKPVQHESDAAIAAAFDNALRQLGIRQRVQLLIDSDRTIPLVWGIVWFRLMLPDSARQWSSEQLRSVLLHELAHIKRRDTLVQLLAQFACALHWFNPLVWFAAWRLHVERERACDDLVLAQGVRASAYAEHLLNVATKLSVSRWTSACGLAMANHSPLESRLHAILSDRLNRRKVSKAIGMIGLMLGAGIAIPIAMLRAADDDWNPPSGAHIGSNEFSAYCVHDGKNAAFVIAYQGFTGSSSAHDSNSKTRTWTDSGTITAKKPSVTLSFYRTHTASDKLSITTAPAEARDLSKHVAPLGEFGQKEYDLTKGRVFLLSDNGSVRQLDIGVPVVTDQESLQQLAALIPAILPQDLKAPRTATAPGTYELDDDDKVRLVVRQMTADEKSKYKKQGLPSSFMATLVFPSPEPEAARGPSPWEIILEEVFAFAWEPGSKKLWVTDISEGARQIIWMELGPGADQTRPDPQKVMLREFDFTDPFNIKVSHITTSENGGTWSWNKLLPQAFQAPVLNALGEKGKRLRDFVETAQGDSPAPAPIHKDARTLYEVWQRYARTNGDIPGALVGELAAAVKQFIKYNPTWETVPKLNAILPRLDATRDWKPAEAIELLDEVAGIRDSPLSPAPWKGTRDTIRQGDTLPKEYADVTWGDEQANGLRAAWVLEPNAAEYRIDTALKARLLVQNRGQVPVMLQVPTWHQGWVKGTDAKGSEVQVSGIEWTTMALLNTVRLGPGAYIEINTPGVGIGSRAGMGPWAGPRVGSNVLAKAGDELTLSHGLVPLDGSEVGVSEDDPHVSGPGWWLAHIKTRLNREMPLPPDAAERTRLLDRAVRELFANAPTAEETEAFIADKTPDALDALAKRLAERADVVSFSGKLPTAPVKFRVLDSDANAGKQPRVVLGPGEYPLSGGTATSGAVTLKIIGRPVGDRRTNDAGLLFEATEATGKLALDPHKLDIPDGWGTWVIVCRPGEGFFYLLTKGAVRKIDYTNPREVTDTPVNDLPAEFRDEVKRQLDIHEISAEQQAEIFEKPGETKFRESVAEPDAAKAPRTATAPGRYVLGEGVHLQISPTSVNPFRVGSRPFLQNKATIVFLSSDPSDPKPYEIAPPKPCEIELPSGEGTYAFAWVQGSGELWLLRKGENFLWRYRFAADGLKEEGRYDLWPQTVLSQPLRRALQDAMGMRAATDIPPLGDEALEQPEPGPGPRKTAKLKPGTEERISWGEPVNGLRAALVRMPPETELVPGAVVDLNVVVQNASDAPVKLRGGSPLAGVNLKAVRTDGTETELLPSIVDVLSTIDEFTLQPREVAVMSLMSLGIGKHDTNTKSAHGRAVGYWLPADKAIVGFNAEATFSDKPPGFWSGTLSAPFAMAHSTSGGNAPTLEPVSPEPSGASAPKLPKLPDESYDRRGVHFQKFLEEDAKRPSGKLLGHVLNPSKLVDGPLVLGLRVAHDATWNIGSETRVELVVRNQSQEDVRFAQTLQSDIGLSVVAIDKDGKEYPAKIAPSDTGLLVFNRWLLPKNGYVTMVKSFTIRFDAEERFDSDLNVAAFHLPPGKYKLRCKWNDAHPDVAHEGEWTGELVNEELELTLAAEPAPTAEKPKGVAAVKVTPDSLLGSWRGRMDGKKLVLSFHRPPVEKDMQLDIYEGEATIGAPARFTIAEDGKSADVVLDHADSAAFATLHPVDANTMRLESEEKEGKAATFVVLTRDVEPPATEPGQKEPRELFAIWKATANADGSIPGTFIGQLAAEVRTYVKAHPTLDSAAKLPKLLPRFVTSRDWTQAEAIKLLDDVAYYATEPIAARVAKAKLPSSPLWPTEVEFEDIPVQIAK